VFAARLLEGAAQEELDLRVEAAQIVVRPALDGLQQGWINTKQERFSVSHCSLFPDPWSLVPDYW